MTMEITVKLFPTLVGQDHPKYVGNQKFALALPLAGNPRSSIFDLIDFLELDRQKVHQAVVNGQIVHDFNQVLQTEDYIYLSPAIGGG